jgi:hypothetical protein
MRDYLTLSWARFSKDVQSHTLSVSTCFTMLQIISNICSTIAKYPKFLNILRLEPARLSKSMQASLVRAWKLYVDFLAAWILGVDL